MIIKHAQYSGDGDYKVDHLGEAQLFGEIVFHYAGYIHWDKKDNNSIYSSCSEIDLSVRKDGDVNDHRKNIVLEGLLNNMFVRIGTCYDYI